MRRVLRVAALCMLTILPAGGAGAQKPPSVSLGNASDGRLLHSAELALQGDHHRVLSATRRRGYHFGTDELVGALERAAAAVAEKHPGATLFVGNLSKREGGDIHPSVSHNSGRDADLAFYARDRRGRPLTRLRRMVRFDSRGRGGRLRFDTERNWTLVRALLTDEAVQVQWIFVSTPLRELLLDWAREHGAPAALIERAENVLGQPGNSSAHAEHLHVRLYCALHERLRGCLNYGPTHAWIDDFAAEVEARTRALVTELESPDAGVAEAAAHLLGAIRGHSAVDALARAVADPRPAVRAAAARSVVLLDGREAAVPALVAALDAADSRAWTHKLVGLLGRIGDPRAAEALLAVLSPERGARPRTRVLALAGLGAIVHAPAVPALVRSVSDPDRAVREAAETSLRRITNHDFGKGRRAARRWRAWWRRNKDRPRIAWVRAGFARLHGIRVAGRERAGALRKLVELIRGGGHLGFNARTLIEDTTGFTMQQGHYSNFQMYRFYKSWLRAGGAETD